MKSPESRNSRLYFETAETVLRLFWTLFGPWGWKALGDSLETPVRGGRGCKDCLGDNSFTTAGADASGCSAGKHHSGKNFPRLCQRLPRNYDQRWC